MSPSGVCFRVRFTRGFVHTLNLPRCLPLLAVVTKNYGMSLEWIGYSRKDFTFPSDQVPVVVVVVLVKLVLYGSPQDVVKAQVDFALAHNALPAPCTPLARN